MNTKRKKKIKFITLYNEFTEKEKTEFEIYLKSVSNKSHRDYNRILSSLKFSKDGVLEIEGNYSDVTRWNRFSELHLHAENFLVLKSLESESLIRNYLLLKQFNKKNLKSPFISKYNLTKKENSDKPFVNYDYNVSYEIDLLHLNQLKSKTLSKETDQMMNEIHNFRIGVFLYELLELKIQRSADMELKLLKSESLVEKIFPDTNFENIILYLRNNADSPGILFHLINFLFLIYKSFIDPGNNSSYKKAKKIFFKNFNEINPEKRTNYYVFLINHNINRVNLSINGAAEEAFILINKKLNEGLVDDLKANRYNLNHFRNYIIIALGLKKYNWVEKFIEKYGHILPAGIRETSINMGKALLLFNKKEYSSTYEVLNKIEKITAYHYVDVSVLRLKVLFEMKKIDECHDELRRFIEYLRKDRSADNHIIINSKNFCKAFSLLLKLYEKPLKKNLIQLQSYTSVNNLIGKKWILDMANGILPE